MLQYSSRFFFVVTYKWHMYTEPVTGVHFFCGKLIWLECSIVLHYWTFHLKLYTPLMYCGNHVCGVGRESHLHIPEGTTKLGKLMKRARERYYLLSNSVSFALGDVEYRKVKREETLLWQWLKWTWLLPVLWSHRDEVERKEYIR